MDWYNQQAYPSYWWKECFYQILKQSVSDFDYYNTFTPKFQTTTQNKFWQPDSELVPCLDLIVMAINKITTLTMKIPL